MLVSLSNVENGFFLFSLLDELASGSRGWLGREKSKKSKSRFPARSAFRQSCVSRRAESKPNKRCWLEEKKRVFLRQNKSEAFSVSRALRKGKKSEKK